MYHQAAAAVILICVFTCIHSIFCTSICKTCHKIVMTLSLASNQSATFAKTEGGAAALHNKYGPLDAAAAAGS